MDSVTGKCITDRSGISVDRIEALLTAGVPDLETIKRNAYLAKLPLISAEMLFIGSDRKCAEQFQQTMAMEGLEKRKRLSELQEYGCGFITDGPVRAEILRKDSAFVAVKLANGQHAGKSGWVPAAWVK